jgi:hypothetical protein
LLTIQTLSNCFFIILHYYSFGLYFFRNFVVDSSKVKIFLIAH